LNHLLARFAENFADFSLRDPKALIQAKSAFLQDYRQLGAKRGAAFNACKPAWDTNNVSGLEMRISRKLGLSTYRRRKLADMLDKGGFHIVEHILLRPCAADQAGTTSAGEAGVWQTGVLLALTQETDRPPIKDPYSRQISFIFPNRISGLQSKDSIRQLLRDETPAHLQIRCLWLKQEEMRAFEATRLPTTPNLL
jgi:hypothetical protein